MHRTDLTSQIPDFISIGEYWLARDLRVSQLISVSNVTIAALGNSVALPTGAMGVVEAKLASSGAELKYIPPDTLARANVNANSVTIPSQYTLIGSSIYVAPTWTAGGSVTLQYFKKETVLSGANTSNWYLANCPDALLYASLLQAAPYLGDASKATMWKEFYQNNIQQMNQQYGVLDANARMVAMSNGPAKAFGSSL